MNFIELRRNHIQWSINQNPTKITIRRKGKVRVGGGFDLIDEEISPITVRLYIQNTADTERTSEMIGTKDTDTSWGLLADYKADIQHAPNVQDCFVVNDLGQFEVRSVKPQMVQEQVVGYQVSLERVK